ncbi:MAG TPA: prolipoprotein diacylglyceryl transferase [Caulobacteraceae bacterium]|nr:prolipoprotein diacylglyceryl transferase [Caulobacteraceae bacterium]
MALPYPNIPPDVFDIPRFQVGPLTLGPFALRWYAIAYIAGIVVGWRYAVALARKARLWGPRGPPATPLEVDDMVVWITFGVILGGRIGYVLFYMLPLASQRAVLAADPLEVVKVWHGGMSFHGGAIGVAVALIAYAWRRRLPLLGLADLAAPCAPFGLFFGRIANFINGELWGRPTSLPWGMVFCGPTIPKGPGGECIAGYVPRHPSQLYEAALEGIVLWLILRLATHRFGALGRRGVTTGLFLFFYGLFRILTENVRMPDEGLRHLPLGLTVGMMLSAPMVIVGAALAWWGWRRGQAVASEPRAPQAGAEDSA